MTEAARRIVDSPRFHHFIPGVIVVGAIVTFSATLVLDRCAGPRRNF